MKKTLSLVQPIILFLSFFCAKQSKASNHNFQLALPCELITKIIGHLMSDYYSFMVDNPSEIATTFKHYNLNFDTKDVKLFFPKTTAVFWVSKTWYHASNHYSITEIKNFFTRQISTDKSHFEIIKKTLDSQGINHDILAINPFSSIDLGTFSDWLYSLGYLHITRLNNEINTGNRALQEGQPDFNVTTFLIYKLARVNPFEFFTNETKRLCYFFFQLFFAGPINQSVKSSFLKYVIEYPSHLTGKIFNTEKIIKIALESNCKIELPNKNFWELVEEIHYFNPRLKEKFLMRLGFDEKALKKNEAEYNDFFHSLTEQFDDSMKQKLIVLLREIQINKINLSRKSSLLNHILRTADRMIHPKEFFTELIIQDKQELKKNSILAMNLLNKVVFFLRNRFCCEHHETIVHYLNLKKYNAVYNIAYDQKSGAATCLMNGIQPSYIFKDQNPLEVSGIRKPSLFLKIYLKAFFITHIDEIIEKDPQVIIEDNTTIITLLEKIFNAAEAVEKTRAILILKACKISEDLKRVISRKPMLSRSIKDNRERFGSFLKLAVSSEERSTYKKLINLLSKLI